MLGCGREQCEEQGEKRRPSETPRYQRRSRGGSISIFQNIDFPQSSPQLLQFGEYSENGSRIEGFKDYNIIMKMNDGKLDSMLM